MKAITLWQPWASLWACGAKKFETRSWPTNHRGPIAIHAAAANPYKFIRQLDDATIKIMLDALREHGLIPTDGDFRYLPRGKVIATADLVACHKIVKNGFGGTHAGEQRNSLDVVTDYGGLIKENELLFGDWTPGRYAWEIENLQMLPEPIPAKGKQGFWNCDAF